MKPDNPETPPQKGRPAQTRALWPRGLRRDDAAYYVGIGKNTFDDWVEDGTMPEGKKKGGVLLWDRYGLDAAFDAMFSLESDNIDPEFDA